MLALHIEAQSSGASLDTLSSAELLFRLANEITCSYGILLHNLLSIQDLKEEGQDRLREEEIKTASRHWEPAPRTSLKRQIDEALNENTPKDSLYRKIYIAARSIKPVIIFGLIHNGRNYGNRKRKSKSKDTLEGDVEEGFKDADVKSKSKLTLEEDVKLWPTDVFKALVKVLMTIELPEKIRLYCNYKDLVYKGEGESDGECDGECENGQMVLLKALIQKWMKIAISSNEIEDRDTQNPLKRKRVESTQYKQPESSITQAANSSQAPSGLEGSLTHSASKRDKPQPHPQPHPQLHPSQPHPPQPYPQPHPPQPYTYVQPHSHRQTNLPPPPPPPPPPNLYLQPNPQTNPHLQLAANLNNETFAFDTFTTTALELSKALLKYVGGNRECRAEKLGPSPDFSVRVDPSGNKTGIFSIFLGQAAKNLMKRAMPATTFTDRRFSLLFTHCCDHVLELVGQSATFDIVYCQGFRLVWMSPGCFLVLVLQSYLKIRDEIKRARGQQEESVQAL